MGLLRVLKERDGEKKQRDGFRVLVKTRVLDEMEGTTIEEEEAMETTQKG